MQVLTDERSLFYAYENFRGGGTPLRKNRKAGAALALAVAVYLSSGSLALAAATSGAGTDTGSGTGSGTGTSVTRNVLINKDNNDMVTITAVAPTGAVLNPVAGTTGAKSLTITGGTWNDWYTMAGGYSVNAVDGYSLTLDGVKSSGSHI